MNDYVKLLPMYDEQNITIIAIIYLILYIIIFIFTLQSYCQYLPVLLTSQWGEVDAVCVDLGQGILMYSTSESTTRAYLPLIGWEWSLDFDTGLSLAESDHMTWRLASD